MKAYCRKNGLVMQNYKLGIHRDKIWADSTTKNTLKYLKSYSADLPNQPKYIGYFKKCSHWVSVVCESRHAAQNDMMTCESLKNLGGFQEQKWDQAISAAQP